MAHLSNREALLKVFGSWRVLVAAGEFQNISDAIKILYPNKALEPMLNEELVFRPALMKNLPQGGKVVEGIVKFGAWLSPAQNVGTLLDGGTLPPPKDRSERQFQMTPKVMAGSFQIGWQTKAAVNTGRSGFNGGELARRTEETVSNLGKYVESSYVSVVEGIRGYVESDGSNNVVLKNPIGTKLIRDNMYISIRIAAGSTVRDSIDLRQVTAVDPSTRTVTYSGNDQTAVANDPVYVVNELTQTITADTTTTNGVWVNSVRGLIDDGTLTTYIHTLDRTTALNTKLKSVVDDPGGLRSLTEQSLIRVCNEIRERSGKRPETILCGPGQIEKYIEFVAPQRRFPVTGKGLQTKATGWQDDELVHYAPGTALKFMLSFDVVPRELFLLNWSTFFHYVAADMRWMDEDSLLKATPVSGGHKASWLAYMGTIENLGNDFPLANGVMRNLKDPQIGDL